MQVCHSYRHLKANKLHPEAVAKAGIASVWRWGKVPNISNLLLYSCQLWSLGNKREGLCLSPLGLYLYFNPKSAPPTLHSQNLPLGIDCWDTPKDTHTYTQQEVHDHQFPFNTGCDHSNSLRVSTEGLPEPHQTSDLLPVCVCESMCVCKQGRVCSDCSCDHNIDPAEPYDLRQSAEGCFTLRGRKRHLCLNQNELCSSSVKKKTDLLIILPEILFKKCIK